MSAVRKAIEAVLKQGITTPQPMRMSDTAQTYVHPDLLDRLVAAVEAVPMRVTIRELDMADNENIVSVRHAGDVEYLLAYVSEARRQGVLNLTVDGGCLKVKAGDYGSWSAPVKTEVYNP